MIAVRNPELADYTSAEALTTSIVRSAVPDITEQRRRERALCETYFG